MEPDQENENVVNQPENNKPGKLLGGCTGKGFMPGQSGNPKGRPKGSGSVTTCIRRLLNEGFGNKDIADELAKAAVKHAMKGNFQYFKEIVDRTDGKMPDTVIGDGKIEIVVKYDDDDTKSNKDASDD